jgi:putative acetyltransferase
MRVRRATLEDLDAVARGMKTVADEGRWLATPPGTPVEELAERFRWTLAEDDARLLVLEDDGEAIGAIGLNPTGVPGVLSLGMWILPEWRGRGGGRLLLEAAMEERPAHVHKIELEVWPDNEAAIGLYEATGFEQEGVRRNHYRRRDGTLRSAVLMSRLFDPADAGPEVE